MKKILVIEDDQLIRELLERKLTEKGYQVVSAPDGETGLKKIYEEHPHLILLDVILPRLNGFEILKELESKGMLDELPVIIISNSGQPFEIEEAKRMGVRDWLVKTEFDPEEVLEKVAKQLRTEG